MLYRTKNSLKATAITVTFCKKNIAQPLYETAQVEACFGRAAFVSEKKLPDAWRAAHGQLSAAL